MTTVGNTVVLNNLISSTILMIPTSTAFGAFAGSKSPLAAQMSADSFKMAGQNSSPFWNNADKLSASAHLIRWAQKELSQTGKEFGNISKVDWEVIASRSIECMMKSGMAYIRLPAHIKTLEDIEIGGYGLSEEITPEHWDHAINEIASLLQEKDAEFGNLSNDERTDLSSEMISNLVQGGLSVLSYDGYSFYVTGSEVPNESHDRAKSLEEQTALYAPEDYDPEDAELDGFEDTALIDTLVPPAPGRTLNDTYELIEEIGKGGMGTVFLAKHKRTGRQVAVKVLKSEYSENDKSIERFQAEAQTAADIDHPGIVKIIDVDRESDGTCFIVMEMLSGENLDNAICESGGLPLDRALEITRQICGVLGAAHEKGIVHRDIKPANIFLTKNGSDKDTVKLLDFGVAKILRGKSISTATGTVVGTPLYMSPEQACSSSSVDHRADIFSLGAVLYEMLTGHTPFEPDWNEPDDSVMVVLTRVLSKEPYEMSRWHADVPTWVEEIIMRCLNKIPDERFQSTDDLVRAIDNKGAIPSSLRPSLRLQPSVQRKELRIVSTVCLSFEPTDRAGTEISPKELIEIADAAIDEQGGKVVREFGDAIMGDGIMAVFGAPVAYGDDAARALRAVLEIRNRINKSYDNRIAISAGISTGRVMAGHMRGMGDSSYEVVGNAVKLAWEIKNTSPDGAVRACSKTIEQVRGRFQLYTVGSTFEVLEENPHGLIVEPRETLGVSTPMVGRQIELGQVFGLFQRAMDDSTAHAASVIGPAGIGKSRMAHELRIQVEDLDYDVMTFFGRAEQMAEDTPLALWAGAYRAKAGIKSDESAETSMEKLRALLHFMVGDGEDIEETAHLLGILTGIEKARPEEESVREHISSAIVDTIRKASLTYPMLLVLDDLHWADKPSLDLAAKILDELEDHRVFVLAQARPELLEKYPNFLAEQDFHQRIDLRPLLKRAGRSLVKEIAGNALPDELVSEIAAKAEGIPLFIEMFLSSLAESGEIEQRDNSWHVARDIDIDRIEIPLAIETVIQARLDLLEPKERDLLRRGAVIGQTFWADALFSPYSAGDTKTILQRLCNSEILRSNPASRFGSREYEFRHALVRDAAYAKIPEDEKKELHLATAEWIDSRSAGSIEDLALTAKHFEAGGDAKRAIAAFFSTGAALRGIEVPRSEDGDFEVSPSTKVSSQKVSEETAQEAHDFFTHAIELADSKGDDELKAKVRMATGFLYKSIIGDVKEAIPFLETAAELFSKIGNINLQVTCMAHVAVSTICEHEYEKAAGIVDKAKSMTDQVSDPDTLCWLKRCSGTLSFEKRRFEESIKAYLPALEIAKQADLKEHIAAIAHNIGDCYVEIGDYDTAEEFLNQSQEVAKKNGINTTIVLNDFFLTFIEAYRHGSKDALVRFKQMVAEVDEQKNIWLQMQGRNLLAKALIKRGALDDARVLLQETLAIGEKSGNLFFEQPAYELLDQIQKQEQA